MEESAAEEIEIPCYFLCPISMQLMKDPVTVSTGITYDRENIEKWLFSCKKTTCPVTKHDLSATDLTPNHTLRRLIQAWCAINAHERIPSPKPPVDRSLILKILNQAKNSPKSRLSCLRRLRSVVNRNESSRNHLRAAGAVEFLASVFRENEDPFSRDEALNILQQIELSDSDLRKLLLDNDEFLKSLIFVLERGSSQSRAQAIILLKSAFDVADPEYIIGSRPELFRAITNVLGDKIKISAQATKAALKLLVELCPWGRNKVKAAESGAVAVLIELLLETAERRACELALTVLDQLCGCAEGRAALLRHGGGLAVVSKKILRVSHWASERAVRILSSISKHSGNSRVLEEMMEVGVVSKLCLVLQVRCSEKTKERAKEILRRESRVWRDSSCVPSHLRSSYPCS
ncbi:E3 ubiquitin-protein ligase PUB23 [Sesamum angolense]|uniref:U-box domain-containing protein n=1 Tax=Sesamum angolense TaxID=2727404 RepID=A0AAE1XC74_9LAMI|nr:E3 ubiquitin-protein ligase PUB23 [Sesamum angolense]